MGRREQSVGLGAEKGKAPAQNWDCWWNDVYATAAKSVQAKSVKMSPTASEASSSSDSEDEQPVHKPGSMLTTGIKKAGKQGGKLARIAEMEAEAANAKKRAADAAEKAPRKQ